MKKFILLYVIFLTVITISEAQFISGTITSRETTEHIQGVNIIATNINDTSKHFKTTTNENGYYEISYFFTGISNTPLAFEESLAIFEKNGLMQISATTQQNITQANIYNSWGKIIAVVPLQQVSREKYASELYHNFSKQLLVIQAGHFATKHISGCNYTTLVSPTSSRFVAKNSNYTDQNSEIHNKLKNACLENFDLRIQITHPDTLFQPIDTTIYNLDTTLQNTLDFEMKSWPTFQAQITTALLMPEPVTNAEIIFTNLADTTLKDTMENVHPAGGMYFLSLQIPATDSNRIVPDTLLFSVTTKTGGFDCTTDTIKLTHGDFYFTPNCWLNPANVYASMQLTLTDSLTRDSLKNIKVTLTNFANNLWAISNDSGQVFFDSIRLPLDMPYYNPYHEITLSFENENYHDSTHAFTITKENYYFTYALMPIQKGFTLYINSQNAAGENLPNVNWEFITPNSTFYGNTGANALDTLSFTDSTLEVSGMFKSSKYSYHTTEQNINLQAFTPGSISSQNQAIIYNYHISGTAPKNGTLNFYTADSLHTVTNNNTTNFSYTFATTNDTVVFDSIIIAAAYRDTLILFTQIFTPGDTTTNYNSANYLYALSGTAPKLDSVEFFSGDSVHTVSVDESYQFNPSFESELSQLIFDSIRVSGTYRDSVMLKDQTFTSGDTVINEYNNALFHFLVSNTDSLPSGGQVVFKQDGNVVASSSIDEHFSDSLENHILEYGENIANLSLEQWQSEFLNDYIYGDIIRENYPYEGNLSYLHDAKIKFEGINVNYKDSIEMNETGFFIYDLKIKGENGVPVATQYKVTITPTNTPFQPKIDTVIISGTAAEQHDLNVKE